MKDGIGPQLEHWARSRVSPRARVGFIAAPLCFCLLTPPTIQFGVQWLVGGVGWLKAIDEALHWHFLDPVPALLYWAFAVMPFLALSCWMADLTKKRPHRACMVFLCLGLAGILAMMVDGYSSYWIPLYTQQRLSSTASLVFIFVPIWCMGSMLIGLGLAALITRHKSFRPPPPGFCMKCGYDLTGNESGTCPECGQAAPGRSRVGS